MHANTKAILQTTNWTELNWTCTYWLTRGPTITIRKWWAAAAAAAAAGLIVMDWLKCYCFFFSLFAMLFCSDFLVTLLDFLCQLINFEVDFRGKLSIYLWTFNIPPQICRICGKQVLWWKASTLCTICGRNETQSQLKHINNTKTLFLNVQTTTETSGHSTNTGPKERFFGPLVRALVPRIAAACTDSFPGVGSQLSKKRKTYFTIFIVTILTINVAKLMQPSLKIQSVCVSWSQFWRHIVFSGGVGEVHLTATHYTIPEFVDFQVMVYSLNGWLRCVCLLALQYFLEYLSNNRGQGLWWSV